MISVDEISRDKYYHDEGTECCKQCKKSVFARNCEASYFERAVLVAFTLKVTFQL